MKGEDVDRDKGEIVVLCDEWVCEWLRAELLVVFELVTLSILVSGSSVFVGMEASVSSGRLPADGGTRSGRRESMEDIVRRTL